MARLLSNAPGIDNLPSEIKAFFKEQKLQGCVWEEEDAAVGLHDQNDADGRKMEEEEEEEEEEAEEGGKGIGKEEDEGERRGPRLQACFARTITRT